MMESALETIDKREADSVRKLRAEDRRLWNPLIFERVSDNAEEMCCGWKLVRPSAIYDITKPNAKRKKIAATLDTVSTLSLHSGDYKTPEKCPYMSGELDENYSYVYKGGLGDRADSSTLQTISASAHHFSHPQKHVQTVTLEPSHTSDASAHALASCRAELSRILTLQLKPELLVEQLIIENRLRTMSLAAFPVLDSIDSRSRKSEKAYSHSTPHLGTLPNTHVNYQPPRHKQFKERDRNSRHKPPPARLEAKPPHMEWCDSLSSHRSGSECSSYSHRPLPKLSHHQSALHRRHHSSVYNTHSRQTGNPPNNPRIHAYPTNSSREDPLSSLQYRLPVAIPRLSSDAASERESKCGRHLNTLLYEPDRWNNGRGQHKLNLTTGSSFYYPHVSYSNSKSMKFK